MANSSQKSPGSKGRGTGTRAKRKASVAAKAASKPSTTQKPASKAKAKPKAAPPPVSNDTDADASTSTNNPSDALKDIAEGYAKGYAQGFANAQSTPQAPPQGTTPGNGQGGNVFGGGGLHMGESENYLDFLSRVFQDTNAGNVNTQQFDAMSQSMNMVLGSGPAFAALESMMATTTAQGAVLMNAVQTQRQLDQVGLCCTSACVKQLLNMNNQDSD